MITLTNNPVLLQMRQLLRTAIDVKAYFESKDYAELHNILTTYMVEFEKLTKICPPEVLAKTDLLRHTGWLQKRIEEKNYTWCYKDIRDITQYDIFEAEEKYLHYLTTNQEVENKFYDWQNIHPVIHAIARSRFETYHFADAVEACFKEINEIVKRKYVDAGNTEIDGQTLMRKAFTSTPTNNHTPILKLADNSTVNGRNVPAGLGILALVGALAPNPKSPA